MKETVIRPFHDSDTEQLLKLFDIFGDYFVELDPLKRCIKGPNYSHFFFNKLVKEVQEKEGAIFIAEHKDRIIGFVGGGNSKPSVEEGIGIVPTKWGIISELFVIEEYRGTGVGAKLIKKIEEYFHSKGRDFVKLDVFGPNELARKFYDAQGYTERIVTVMKKI